jgi:hypothetical protein
VTLFPRLSRKKFSAQGEKSESGLERERERERESERVEGMERAKRDVESKE